MDKSLRTNIVVHVGLEFDVNWPDTDKIQDPQDANKVTFYTPLEQLVAHMSSQ